MDITSVAGASAFQQSKIAGNVQSSVAVKVLDSQKQQGAGVLQLLQAASPPTASSDGSLDVKG